MPTLSPLVSGAVTAVAYRCDAGTSAVPQAEHHGRHSVSWVRRGSFGCLCGGRRHELVPGSLLIGRRGDDYTCTHEHHRGGDDCLAFFVDDALVDEIEGRGRAWRSGALPPLAATAVLGALAEQAADGLGVHGLDEIGLAMAARVVDTVTGRPRSTASPGPRPRARAIEAALRIEAGCAATLPLETLARDAGLSPYQFLRDFAAVVGATPHQYRLQCRLRHAARALAADDRTVLDIALDAGFADLSNFNRTFRRASGLPPTAFRRRARGDRNFLQDAGAADA